MNKRIVLAAGVALFLSSPLHAGFDALVSAVQAHRGLHRVPIPGLSLARLAVWIIHPEGVHDFQLATFEGRGQIEEEDLQTIFRENIEAGFRPVVQVHSKRDGESTMVWARPAKGDLIEITLLTHERRGDTVVVHAVLDAAVFAREMGSPRRVSRMARR
jgi:hypothetical protein